MWSDLVDEQGLKNIFTQRGSENAVKTYADLIRNADKRVWAIGMTNRHFLRQHTHTLLEGLKTKDLDVVISFWNPSATLRVPLEDASEDAQTERSIIEVQATLEQGASPNTDWANLVAEVELEFIKRLDELPSIAGQVKILHCSHTSNFTCLVIDTDLFFFPFLDGTDSTNDPIIHCQTTRGIGRRIELHLSGLIPRSTFCDLIYHRVHHETRVNRIKLNR